MQPGVFLAPKSENPTSLGGGQKHHVFHVASTKRNRRNRILTIQNTKGEWSAEPEQIKKIFVDYSKDLFKSSKPSPNEFQARSTIDPSDARGLYHFSSCEEIEAVFRSMGPTNAPGHHGRPPLFYQWTISNEKVVKLIQNFFIYVVLQEGVNDTNISIIPKKRSVSSRY